MILSNRFKCLSVVYGVGMRGARSKMLKVSVVISADIVVGNGYLTVKHRKIPALSTLEEYRISRKSILKKHIIDDLLIIAQLSLILNIKG